LIEENHDGFAPAALSQREDSRLPYGPFRLGIFHKCLQPPEYLHIAQFSQRRCRRLSYVWLAACEGSQKLILVFPSRARRRAAVRAKNASRAFV